MKVKVTGDGSITVANEPNTADRTRCSCGTWKAHWENFSGRLASECMVENCDNPADVGAHVTIPIMAGGKYKNYSFILPMCNEHNGMREEKFPTKSDPIFIWANKKETCEKPSTKGGK